VAHLVLLNAGGTISAEAGPGGVLRGSVGPAVLAQSLPSTALPVREVGVYRGLSEDMTYADVSGLLDALSLAVADPEARGVVVAHGTDTLEESAFLADLMHGSDTPVVFTGAQRAPGALGFDGQVNLMDALAVAGSDAGRGLGAVIVFAGRILAARHARKRRTTAPDAFAADGGDIGRVSGGEVQLFARPVRSPPLDFKGLDPTVEIVTAGLGASCRMLNLLVDNGARGVVLQALGRGNVGRPLVEATARAVAAGCVVAVVSRSDEGGVAPEYEAGRRLADAGALFCGRLDAAKARLALACLLAQGLDHDGVAGALKLYGFA
jgi:L-asparaginase